MFRSGLRVPSCIREYDKVFDDVSALRDCSVILDEESVSYYMARAFDDSVDRIYRKSIIEEMRAIKNEGDSCHQESPYQRRSRRREYHILAEKQRGKRQYQ